MDRDMPLMISDFMGVSRKVTSEDLPNPYFDTIQNLWERKLGELQSRGGSVDLALQYPSNWAQTDNGFIMKLRGGIKRRIAAIGTNIITAATVTTELQKCTLSFVQQSGGQWNSSPGGSISKGGGAGDAGYVASALQVAITLQAVGYGINSCSGFLVSFINSSYNTLQVVVPSGLNSNIKGINIYTESDVYFGSSTSSYRSATVWVGFIDLVSNPNGGTFTFTQAALTYGPTVSSSVAQTFGAASPSFNLTETTGGTLTPGKTYYVAVLANYITNDNGSGAPGNTGNVTSLYRTRVTSVASITLSTTGNAIQVNNISGDTSCYLVAIGEHPQLLQPYFITNSVTINNILGFPKYSPNVVEYQPYDANNIDLLWRGCDSSINDMLIQFQENGTVTPIYCSRLTNYNLPIYLSGFIQAQPKIGSVFNQQPVPFGAFSRFCFAQLGDIALFVNDYGGALSVNIGGNIISERSKSGYFVTDGNIAATAIPDYGTPFVSKSSYITVFKESIVIGGGTKASGNYNRITISNALNPFNFSTTGSNGLLAYIQISAGGDDITGIGLYSFSTADQGIKSQLFVGKRNSIHKLSDIPTTYNNASLDQLSSQIGVASHFTICNTEIGTLFASQDNVYRMNEDGEPTAVGEDISYFLRPEDPTTFVDTRYWNAVVHDGCYKLAYTTQGQGYPTNELWLNISKMKSNKGLPTWYGPHTGRSIIYSFVDLPLSPGDRAKRLCVNGQGYGIYFADRSDYGTDFGNPMTFVLESKHHHGSGSNLGQLAQYMNKLFKRIYLKARVNQTITATHDIYVDETLAETDVVTLSPKSAGATYNDYLAQPTINFPFFPKGRLRGRLIKSKWTITTSSFFSISGIVFFFKPEKRRM